MRIAVTGATGLIGSQVVRQALMTGFDVKALVRGSSSVVEDLSRRGAEILRGDLLEPESLTHLLDGCDAVIHAGAATAGTDAALFARVNVQGTQNALEAANRAGIRRFVHVSTPSVLLDSTHQVGITEEYPLPAKPIGLYARTKTAAEQLVSEQASIEWVITRPKAVFGAGDRTLLPELLGRVRSGRMVRIGKDRVLVGLTAVENVADALLLAATAPEACGKVFHIDNLEAFDLWAFVEALYAAVHPGKQLKSLPFGACLAAARAADHLTGSRFGWNEYKVAILGRSQTLNCARAQKLFGYRPSVELAEAIRKALAGHLSPTELARFEALWSRCRRPLEIVSTAIA